MSSRQKQFEDLQLRVTRFSSIEQELINTRDHLDNELARFKAISEFNRRAIVAHDLADFAEVVAEAIVDVFELEVGIFFRVDIEKSQIITESLVDCDHSPGQVYSVDLADFCQARNPLIESWEQRDLWKKLQLKQIICAPCFNKNNELWALIAGGLTQANQAFYNEISPELRHSFKVFTQQTQSLLHNQQTQQRLVEAQKAADKANEAKSIFLAKMSHEIRTPMNGVLGMAQLLSSSKLTPKQKDFTHKIVNSGEYLLEIINNILDFSKIEAGHLKIEATDFSIAELLNSVADTLTLSAQKKGLELVLLADPKIPDVVIGDPVRLRQVIINLAGNAIKFTEAGHVFIHACVERSVDEKHLMLRCTIEDSGIGIASGKQANLFETFTQADESMTRQYGGTGLGLAISRQLVNLMGGEIGIDSEEGCGSIFSFTTKLSRSLQNNARSESCAQFHGKRLLIVEGSELSRRWFEAMLPAWGLQFKTAVSGKQAAEYLAQDSFDMILMDTTLPEGAEKLCAQMAADPTLASIPRLGLSPMAKTGDSYETDLFVEAVAKPFKADHLHALLCRLFSAPNVTGDETQCVQGRPHVILVDDNNIFAVLLSIILEQNNVRLSVVKDDTTAQDLFQNSHCDLILFDSFLAEKNNWELVQCIRSSQTAAPADLPIIVLTDEYYNEKDQPLHKEISAWIGKSLPLEDLNQQIKQWLQPQLRKGGHILLVEDNLINQVVAEGLLRKEGFEITVADDGKKALEACDKEQFDLILLDIQMPVMNGYETIEAIRRGGTPNAARPILALTASADTMARKKMENAKFDAIILKPFKAPRLLGAIEQALRNAG